MKVNGKLQLAAVTILLLFSSASRAAFLGFSAMSNAELKDRLVEELRKARRDLAGEPLCNMIQELVFQVEASYETDPYAWMDLAYEFCNVAENIYGPVIHRPGTAAGDRLQQIRSRILNILDYPYHEVSLQNGQAWKDGDTRYYSEEQRRRFHDATYSANRQRRLNVSLAMQTPLEDGECQLIKLYSSGYILRTKDHCVAADLCYRRCFDTADGIGELADAIDVLFTSHPHDDHYDLILLDMLRRKGIPMLEAPSEVDPGRVDRFEVPLADGGRTDVTAVHSRQGGVPLMMFLAGTDGWSFLHIADSSLKDTWASFCNGEIEAPDFLFSPQDTPLVMKTASLMKGARDKPYFYFTTHENEFEHSVCRRAAYCWLQTASHCLGGPYCAYSGNVVLMDAGESLIFGRN